MQVGIMVTNGGPHPPDYWAETTANQIVTFDTTDPSSPRVQAGRALVKKIEAVLTAHHETNINGERAALKEHGHARLMHANKADEHIDCSLDDIVGEVVAAADGTEFAAHFARSDVKVYLRTLIGSHFQSAQRIERSWHADKHPDTDEAKTFKMALHGSPEEVLQATHKMLSAQNGG